MMIAAVLALTLPYACLGFGLLGGTSDITLAATDANVMFAKQKTMEYFAAQGNSDAARTFTVKSATSQVVSGMLYNITLESNMYEQCSVTVWEQAWMTPQRQITNGPTCVAVLPYMSKRAGGVSATTLSMDDVNVQFAKQATMAHFAATGAADSTRTYSIKSATKQVVSGMLYTIIFSTSTNEECTVKVWEQSWMTPQRSISSGPTCVATMNKRQIGGGVSATTLSMDDVNVQFAKQATMAHFAATGAADSTRTYSIKSATKQVVSGMLYTIIFATSTNEECTVKVWEQSWMTPQRSISSGPTCTAAMNKRQMVGGVSSTNLAMNDVNVQFAKQATMAHFAATGAADSTRTFSIKSSTSQVVAGVLYTIVFGTNMNEECTVQVWEQSWMTPQRSISSGPTCVAAMNKRQLGGGMPGGVSAADMNSQELKDALAFGAKAINNMENSMYVRKVQGSFTATKQVVAGMKYVFTDVVLAQTDCFKGSNTDLSMCNVSDPASEITCTFTIVVQAWMDPSMSVLNWSC